MKVIPIDGVGRDLPFVIVFDLSNNITVPITAYIYKDEAQPDFRMS